MTPDSSHMSPTSEPFREQRSGFTGDYVLEQLTSEYVPIVQKMATTAYPESDATLPKDNAGSDVFRTIMQVIVCAFMALINVLILWFVPKVTRLSKVTKTFLVHVSICELCQLTVGIVRFLLVVSRVRILRLCAWLVCVYRPTLLKKQ